MLSMVFPLFERLLPQTEIGNSFRRWIAARQGEIDIEEMPDSWKRDVGILDGRGMRETATRERWPRTAPAGY